jgi:hypothetical protein
VAAVRPFVLSMPIYDYFSTGDGGSEYSAVPDLDDVVELASSCVVNATRHD